MTSNLPAAPRRRLRWPWVLALLLSPVVLLAVSVVNVLTLDRPAATLRRSLASASPATLDTRIQFSVGPLLLGATRFGLSLIQNPELDRIRPVLGAVRHASIGVYAAEPASDRTATAVSLEATRAAMESRGWQRLVGVIDDRSTVMIFTRESRFSDGQIDLCLAVRDGGDLVVVSTSIDGDRLADWAARDLSHLVRPELPWIARKTVSAPPTPGT